MQFMEVFQGVVPEPFGDLHALQESINLPVKLCATQAFLGAFPIFVSGAMVIRIVKEQGAGHVHNWDLASRTSIAVAICEFEPATATHDLVLLLRRHH